jgi:tetratricopeptide (TPR) repeat protein
MDCRRSLVLAAALAASLAPAGCFGPFKNNPFKSDTPAAARREAPPPPPERRPAARLEASVDKKKPKPMTEVRFADFQAAEATKPGLDERQREAIRDRARKAYQRALEIDPTCVPAYAGLGRLYTSMADYERAVVTFNKALEKKPRDASLWADLGWCYCRAKDFEHGLRCMKTAHELEPESRPYAKTYGLALARAGQAQESFAVLSKVMDGADAHYTLARMHEHLAQGEQARHHLQLALQARPDHAGARALLAKAAAPAGGPATARQAAPPAQAVQPVASIGFLPDEGFLPAGGPTP